MSMDQKEGAHLETATEALETTSLTESVSSGTSDVVSVAEGVDVVSVAEGVGRIEAESETSCRAATDEGGRGGRKKGEERVGKGRP